MVTARLVRWVCLPIAVVVAASTLACVDQTSPAGDGTQAVVPDQQETATVTVDGPTKAETVAASEPKTEVVALADGPQTSSVAGEDRTTFDATAMALAEIAKVKVAKHDWPQWGGWSGRNNTPPGKNIPHEWDIDSGKNIKWTAKLGSQTYGTPVVANGKIYVGTNNGGGYLKRFPDTEDKGCLLCFEEKTGKFLWQHTSNKLSTGEAHDWPLQGICDSPCVDGDRLWFVSSRGEVVCLDTEGFYDGENDGPFKDEAKDDKLEADVVWKYDMMGELGSRQHNMAACSVTCGGDVLFAGTSNGVDDEHLAIPAPDAPSFLAMDRNTGKVLWTDNSPGKYILHGQWSSPMYGVFDDQPQAVFCGGDGWVYSFDPQGDGKGNAKLLWKFDANPKESKWVLGGRGTRNSIIATPVTYDGLIYVAVGQDPEHGEGVGHLWCIDPTKRGDISSELAVDSSGKPLPRKRLQAVDTEAGEKAVSNPNSAVVWHYSWIDENGDKEEQFVEVFHRALGSVAIKNDLLFVADFAGLFHCLDAKKADKNKRPTVYWKHDMFAAAWGWPLIVDGKVYMADEDGEVAVFKLSQKKELLGEIDVGNAVYGTPVVANNVLYIASRTTLLAITPEGK